MRTAHWGALSARIRERDGGRCQICGTSHGCLQVHHLTYDRCPGHELDDDLVLLCANCHRLKIHDLGPYGSGETLPYDEQVELIRQGRERIGLEFAPWVPVTALPTEVLERVLLQLVAVQTTI